VARPPEFLFNHETKQKAKERAGWKCELCGEPADYLEVHHRIAIWFALEVPALSYIVISSLANAQVVCGEDHSKLHAQESRTYYAQLAPQVLKEYLESTIRPEKDDWRKKIKGYRPVEIRLSGDD